MASRLATSPQPSPDTPLRYHGHIARLDSLRGLAILAVVVCHAYATSTEWTHWHGLAAAFIAATIFGHLGVHLFFLLSGFLITGILLDSEASSRRASGFYLRRARRILPVYLLVLAALRATHQVDWHFVLAAALFVVNMGRLVGAHLAQYSVAWSLAVEEQFYLVWPWIVWRASHKSVGRIIVACLVLAPLLRLALAVLGQDTYYKTWANLDYLMYGALVAYAVRAGRLHSGNIRLIARRLFWCGWAGTALSVGIWAVVGDTPWAEALFVSVGRLPEVAVFLALLLGALIVHQPVASLPNWPPSQAWIERSLAFLGYISYGLYLVHELIFRLYDQLLVDTPLSQYQQSFALLTLRALLCSTLSILLAWLSRSTLEAWFLRRKRVPPSQPSAWQAPTITSSHATSDSTP